MMKHFSLCLAIALLPFSSSFAQEETEVVDIDEWQVMKAEAAKDPFAKTDQFSINFANYAVEEWCYPLRNGKVISPFGGSRRHGGTDIKTFAGDTVRAAFAGEVLMSGPYYGYGNFVLLRHANGLETAYSHASKNLVKVGAWVHAGDPIAIEGRTGRATTDHLHFETRVKGKAFDSAKIYDHANHTVRKEVIVFRKQKDGSVKIAISEK